MNASNLMKNDMPMPFGYGASVVLSGSMEPALSVDDLIIVKEVEDYVIGDMVVFQSQGSLIVHRIVLIEEEGIVTKGDANNVTDDAIELKDIKGKVILAIPGIGGIVDIIKSPVMTVIMIGLSLLFTELSFKDKKNEDDEKLEMIKEEIRRLKEEL